MNTVTLKDLDSINMPVRLLIKASGLFAMRESAPVIDLLDHWTAREFIQFAPHKMATCKSAAAAITEVLNEAGNRACSAFEFSRQKIVDGLMPLNRSKNKIEFNLLASAIHFSPHKVITSNTAFTYLPFAYDEIINTISACVAIERCIEQPENPFGKGYEKHVNARISEFDAMFKSEMKKKMAEMGVNNG